MNNHYLKQLSLVLSRNVEVPQPYNPFKEVTLMHVLLDALELALFTDFFSYEIGNPIGIIA